MVKVFFADAGTREQLLTTMDRIEREAAARLTTLADLADARPLPFPDRAHLSAIDPGSWNTDAFFDALPTTHPRTSTTA